MSDSSPSPRSGEQRQRARLNGALFQHLDRTAPGPLLAVVDLAQIQHMALHHPAAGNAPVLDDAEIAMLLAVLPANLLAQKHCAREVAASPWPGK
ncbi:MAG: hypothetical protein JO095_10015 [Alphaproteobacteria bacterium]|nr:hypothetical protein [Alphaproteobacteria bacterium]